MNLRPINLQTTLFDPPNQPIRIDQQFNMVNADILYWPGFLNTQSAESTLNKLYQSLHWEQRQLQVYNKTHVTPRLVAWCADPGVLYRYSNDTAPRQEWPPELLQLKEQVETVSNTQFNGALLNYYRNGDDCMGWHSDDESSLGPKPIVASLSLGANRTFQFKPKPPAQGQRIDMNLESGSLLLMRGNTQHFWQHALPKRKRISAPRLNITFRYIHER